MRIYSNESSILVNHVKNILESEGVNTIIKNETMQGIGIGELGMCWPEVWLIDKAQFDLAKSVIDIFLADEKANLENWTCPSCTETNEATFNLCWNCNQSHSIS